MADDSEDVGIVLDAVEFSEGLTEEGHLKICRCGHALEDHGCDDSLNRDEFNRRAKVAVRIDELLEASFAGIYSIMFNGSKTLSGRRSTLELRIC